MPVVVGVWTGRHRILFLNGKPVGKWPCKTKLTAGQVPLRLAARGENGAAGGFLDGDLAMPVIYRRALTPEEVAEAILYLVSDAAQMVTGSA